MNATAPTLSAAERIADMRHYLNEAHQFAAMSPRGRDCIGIALDMLDDLEADAKRLDWLETQGHSYGFQDMHEGNRWLIDGPFPNLRAAIDAGMKP